MKTAQLNPAAVSIMTAWTSAKEAEKSWAEYRRKLEEQILELHPGLLESLVTELNASQALSVTTELGPMKLEQKRELILSQEQAGLVIAGAPFLAGGLFRCEWKPVSSRAVFGAMHGEGTIAEQVRGAVSFKTARPYFTTK